jgi:polysulfide reductase chain C
MVVFLQTTWGWTLIWAFFTSGTGAGAYIAGVASEYFGEKYRVMSKIGVSFGPPLVLAGMLLLLADLKNPANLLQIFNNPSSILAIGAATLSAFVVVSAIHVGLWLWPTKFLATRKRLREAVGVAGSLLAFGVIIYPGMLMAAVSNSVALWNMGLPFVFLGMSAVSGLSVTALTLYAYQNLRTGQQREAARDSLKLLSKPMILLYIFELVALFFYISMTNFSGTDGSESAGLLLTGALAPLFWGGLIGGGLMIPLVLQSVGVLRSLHASLAVTLGCAFELTGALALRYLVFSAGVSIAPEPFTAGKEVFFYLLPSSVVSSISPITSPALADYSAFVVLFVVLAVIAVLARVLPAPKQTTE